MDWTDRVKKDLTPFADPNSTINYSGSNTILNASWTSRRVPFSASFKLGATDVSVVFDGSEMSYRTFLSHPAISDVLGLAGMILQVVGTAPFFVDTRASQEASGGIPGSQRPALSALRNALPDGELEETKVVFVTGDAGAGKTEVLKQLVREQAKAYTRGETDSLFLYVNAQGRALARLDEALATELQDLRANLTYHAIPSLARNGIVVPLIDGFDELLGVLGYEDSFSSLRRFLTELDGRGALIASARSTYYQQEFLSRSNTNLDQRISVEQIEILPWGEAEFRDYIDKRYTIAPLPILTLEEFKIKMTSAFQQAPNLKTKPFFLAKTADLILNGGEVEGADLVDQLVDGYIERERIEKLLDKNGAPLLSRDQITLFIKSIAEEMWLSETRSLDQETVRLVAEITFPDDFAFGESGDRLRERAPTMAFFSPSLARGRIEFEHELFFSYFLGIIISHAFSEGAQSLLSVLARSILPENAADFGVNRVNRSGLSLSTVSDICSSLPRSPLKNQQVRENCGNILAAYFRLASSWNLAAAQSGVEIKGLVFAGDSFRGVNMSKVHFSDVEFRRADFVDAKFTECRVSGVTLNEIVVSPSTTRIEFAGLNPSTDVYGLRIQTDGGIQQLFRNDAIYQELVRCGVPLDAPTQQSSVDASIMNLLERVLRKFEKSSLFWSSDPENRQIAVHPDWPDLERLLIQSGLATEADVDQKGTPRKALKRNYLPQQIMRGETINIGVPENVTKFWQALRHRWPAIN